MSPLLNPPAPISSGVTQTGGSIPVMDAAVAALIALPVPDATILPQLPADVDKTRTDAQLWTTQYRLLARSTLQGVVDFGATFDVFYQQMVPLADQVAAGDKAAISQLRQLLQSLQEATSVEGQTAQSVATQLVSYSELLDADLAALNGDEAFLQTTQKTEQAIAAQAQQAADMVQKELSAYEQKLALAILQGHYLVAELQVIINTLTGRLDTLRAEEDNAQSTAYQAGQQAAAAASDALKVAQYQADLGALAGGVSQLVNGWQVMDANFAELQEAEDIHSFGSWTPALLSAAQADWDSLAAQAQGMLEVLSPP